MSLTLSDAFTFEDKCLLHMTTHKTLMIVCINQFTVDQKAEDLNLIQKPQL